MVRYYDSSIMLAGVLGQKPHRLIASLWDSAEIRLSSTLAKIECLVGVRRAGTLQKLASDDPWCLERIHLLEAYLEELDCKHVDDDILTTIRRNVVLSDCRSLDAIHIATALYFRPFHDEPIQVVTLDTRMRETAVRAGFTVLPA
jgi:predicted nucleic acid-binding protein